jgi:hypothetical protein
MTKMIKCICIKDITLFMCKVKPNNIIYVEKKQFDRNYYWRIEGDEYFFTYQVVDTNGFNSGFNMSETNFREFFVLLSELREQQIKTILDD